jgi:ribulose-5-phosphate 4-epimerase/fuculose-1-phosphate aldolase
MSDESALRERICAVGKSIFDRGLTGGSSGNVSARLDDGWLLTPTGASLGELDPARLSKLDDGGRLLAGDPPSKELFLHAAMYEARAAAGQPMGGIVHLHSTHAVAVSCLPDIDPANVLPPLTAYYVMRVGACPLVPYYRPGDSALGAAVRGLAGRHSAVLLANHGPVVAGRSLDAALAAIEELEETAKLHLLLAGRKPRLLTPERVADLHRHFPS